MNLTLDGISPPGKGSDIQFISFNQNYTSISVGSKTGFQLYSIDKKSDDVIKTYSDKDHHDICIVERLFSSSFVVLVSLMSPRKLRMIHSRKKQDITIINYINTILSVKLNRKRLVVCLEDQIYIHSLECDSELSQEWIIRNIPPNPTGLCALSPNENASYLAYPASQHNGEVQIFDTSELKNKILIPLHDNQLAALAFNNDGTMLASASEKGTVIRVHNVSDGKCLHEFRRGYARCVDIYSLSFDTESKFLAASSNTETVHIFKLEQPREDPVSAVNGSWSNYFTKALMQSSAFLPTQFSDMLNQWRSFATCRLPFKQLKNVCAITNINNKPRVLVMSSEGYLYFYDLNIEGGDCTLLKQQRLDDVADPEPNPDDIL